MVFITLIVTGLAVGLISSFFGVGGGLLTVPILYTLFPQTPPQTIIASSLGLIFVNSMINVKNFIQAGKRPLLPLSLSLSVFMILGVIAGGKLALIIDGRIIKIIFASALALIALKILFTRLKSDQFARWGQEISAKLLALTALSALLGGLIAGLTGLGGGAVLVPFFISVLHMPFHWIPVYSNVGMGLGCLAGVITYMLAKTPLNSFSHPFIRIFQVGHVNWAIVFFIFIGAIISSKWGVKANEKVDPKRAQTLFAALLIIFSLRLFIKSFA